MICWLFLVVDDDAFAAGRHFKEDDGMVEAGVGCATKMILPTTGASSALRPSRTSFRRRPPNQRLVPALSKYPVRTPLSSSFVDQAKMSDNEFAIESTDTGASETIPMEAGQIKKGG